MSDGYELGTARTFQNVAQTGYEVPFPHAKLGFDPDSAISMVAYNREEGNLYLFVITSADNLHIYREVQAIENRWNAVAGDDSNAENSINQGAYSVNNASLKHPLVTPKNTLLISLTGNNSEIIRLPDWGDSAPTSVTSSAAPLYWRHAIDESGDIYAADYSGSTDNIIKSTDDGQTWSTIVSGVTPADHWHGIAAAPHQDVICWTEGDSGSLEYHFAHKDGSNHKAEPTMGLYGEADLRMVPVMPIGNTQNAGGNYAESTWLFGSDQHGWSITRGKFKYSSKDGSGGYLSHYGMPDPDATRERSYVQDIRRTPSGRIVALMGQAGLLGVSDDGFMWDWIDIPFTGDSGFATNHMEQTPKGLVCHSPQSTTIIPWSTVNEVDIKATTYKFLGGNPNATTSSGVTLGRFYMAHKIKEWKAIGHNSDSSWAIQWDEQVNGSQESTKNNIVSGSSGTVATGTRQPIGRVGNILSYPIESDSEIEVTAIRE